MTVETPPGVYLDMPEEIYHADTALGSSGICDLLVSPETYWWRSAHNTHRRDTDTAAQAFGSYFHVLIEGRASDYAVKPEGMSFATKEGKAWRAEAEEAGRKIIDASGAAKADTMVCAMRSAGIIDQIDGAFHEVSIFWSEKGYRCKARLDAITPRASWDWKTFQNTLGKDLETAIAHKVAAERLHVRSAWYQRALQAAASLKAPEAFKPVADAIQQADDWPHWYCFIGSDIPHIITRRFKERDSGGKELAYHHMARFEINRATDLYARCMDRFGPGNPWQSDHAMKGFADEDFTAARWILWEE